MCPHIFYLLVTCLQTFYVKFFYYVWDVCDSCTLFENALYGCQYISGCSYLDYQCTEKYCSDEVTFLSYEDWIKN